MFKRKKEMTKKEIALSAYGNAINHGFKFDDLNENLINAMGELYEGLEHKMRLGEHCWNVDYKVMQIEELNNTVEMEIADCYIRTMAVMGALDYDFEITVLVTGVSSQIEKANSYTDFMVAVGERLLGSGGFEPILYGVCNGIELWCNNNAIDLQWFVATKMEYNKTREHLHGKQQTRL